MLRLVCIAVFGAWLGLANPILHIPFAILGLPIGLAWIAFRAQNWKSAYKFGWLAGALATTGCLYWFAVPVAVHGGLSWWLAMPCPLLAGMVIGNYYALFVLIMHFAARRMTGWPLYILAGLAWASMEGLMSILFTGFPWLNITAAFAPWPIVVQGASLIGAYGMAGMLAMFAVSGLLVNTYKSARYFLIIMITACLGFGAYQMHYTELNPARLSKPVPIALIQGNIDQGKKWVKSFQKSTVETYVELTRKALVKEPKALAIWPETAMPFYMQEANDFSVMVRDFISKDKAHVLTGAPAYRITDRKKRSYVLLNRAFLLSPGGNSDSWYDKEHLVPFGEYVPLQKWLPIRKLVANAGDFVSGTTNFPLVIGNNMFGVLICYEGIFPSLAQKQVAKGAQFLVNISNDAWFGRTSAPLQHLYITTLRAIEQQRWIARGTNNGISAFVDPRGRIISRTPQDEAVFLDGKVLPIDDTTVYHAIQEYVMPIAYILTGLGILLVAALNIWRPKNGNKLK